MGSATAKSPYYPWGRTHRVAQLFRIIRDNLNIGNNPIDDALGVTYDTGFASYTDEHIRTLELLAGPYGHAIMKMLRLKQNV